MHKYIKRLEDSGAAAVVMFSIFEEQILLEEQFRRRNQEFADSMGFDDPGIAESLNYFPDVDDYALGPEDYLELINSAAESVDIPIFASLNCVTAEGWIDYARKMQQAGAHGLELNIFSLEPDFRISGAEVDQRYVDILKMVKSAVTIPVALKLSPFSSSIGHTVKRLDEAGADAMVLFNRFYQPDIDVENLKVLSRLKLSNCDEIRLPLLWIALLYGQINASIGATTGVESSIEVVKYLLAGADVVMTASSLLRKGPAYIGKLVEGLEQWMEAKGFDSVGKMKGILSHRQVDNPRAFVRSNYIKLLESFTLIY
jgi:dihydroorotate dehydrogenase (fumarate)